MKETLIKDVSDTAFMVAAYRAQEGDREDALFHDPLARKLAGEYGLKIVENMSSGVLSGWTTSIRARGLAWTMAMRTCIIDEFITAAAAQGADAVLNLGAGLDTRPYRMVLPPSLHWIEVDYPRMIEFKDRRLAEETPRCRLERIKLDLIDIAARRQMFADVSNRFQSVLVLTEGVLPYLNVDAAAELAEDLRAQPAFRGWIADYISPATMRFRKRGALRKQMANAPFLFMPKDYFGFFSARGWRVKETRYIWDEGVKRDRPMPLPFFLKFWFALKSAFMSPRRRQSLRHFMAYVMFEPGSVGPSPASRENERIRDLR